MHWYRTGPINSGHRINNEYKSTPAMSSLCAVMLNIVDLVKAYGTGHDQSRVVTEYKLSLVESS